MKKKILIVGGSHSEIPLIKAAKEKGLYVITTGNQKNGIGHRYSDEFHIVDYSKENDIYKLADKLKIDYICFGAHDLSLFSTVYTAEKLGLPFFDDYETTSILHHKDKFKEFARKNNLKTPLGYSFNSIKDAIDFAYSISTPFVIKPIDMGGGKGVSVVNYKSEIETSIKKAFSFSKNKRIVIEEFFEGSLHSISTFIKNQKIVFHYVDNEFPCKNNPYGVCTSTSPSKDFYKIKHQLIKEIEKVAQLLKLKDGLLHVQYIQNGKEFTIIEYTRRLPGDLYNIPVELSTGFKYSHSIIEYCLGIKISCQQFSSRKFISRHCLVPIKKGIFENIYISPSIKNNILFTYIWEKKSKITTFPKSGIVFLEYSSYEEMETKTLKINDLIKLEIKPLKRNSIFNAF